MKSNYVLLIIGAGLLISGLVISGISVFAVTKQILEDGAIIDANPLEPGLSYVAILKDLPEGRQLILSLSSEPSDIPLNATLTEADGDVIGTYNITQTPFTTTLLTREPGDHSLEVVNAGTRSVTVSGALLNSPVAGEGGGVSVDDSPGLQTLVTYGIGILAGIVLVIAGIVVLIIGAVKFFRSRKTPETMPN